MVGRTLENLTDPKAKMDAAMDIGEKMAILQSIGPEALLVERKIGKTEYGGGLNNDLQGNWGKNRTYIALGWGKLSRP